MKFNSPVLLNRLGNIFPYRYWECTGKYTPSIFSSTLPVERGVYWVNLRKRGGKDRAFRGLAGLLWEISWEQSLGEISTPALPTRGKPRPSWPFYSDLNFISNRFPYSVLAFLKSEYGSVLALLKSIDSSVSALLRLPSIFSHNNSTDIEFWFTMASMQEKQQSIWNIMQNIAPTARAIQRNNFSNIALPGRTILEL